MGKEKESNRALSKEILESYRKALYKVKDFFDNVEQFDMAANMDHSLKVMDAVLKAGEKLGKNIETLAILEAKVEKDELQKTSRRGNVKTSLFEE